MTLKFLCNDCSSRYHSLVVLPLLIVHPIAGATLIIFSVIIISVKKWFIQGSPTPFLPTPFGLQLLKLKKYFSITTNYLRNIFQQRKLPKYRLHKKRAFLISFR